jgi:UDP:flavonoid glycosyltransferase YjiC (YdhE family)
MTTPGKPGSVAVICFLPDYGHLQPVLKIADALAERGFEIKCYVPDECAALMSRLPFDVTLLPNAQLAEPKRRLAKVFARGLFFNAACSYVHYLLCYPRIAESASSFAPELQRQLSAQGPDVILCDAHFFEDWCRRIATSVGAPLVINSLDGSLAYNQRPFVQIYGATSISSASQTAVELVGAGFKTLCAHVYRLRYLRTWLRLRAVRRAATAVVDAAFPVMPGARPVEVQRVVVGTATIERDRLGALLRRLGADRPEFPPIRFRTRAVVPDELRQWVESDARPVVYVSFGSAVEFDRSFATAVHEGLRKLPARVLWSLPAGQKALLARVPPAKNIRIEPFVPQAEVLALPSVRCFITQAGPSSVQESLLGATPMLCIPFFADQGYNSAIVQHLGVGRKLWHRAVSARSILDAVTAILENAGYHHAVRDIQQHMLRHDGGELVANHLAEIVKRGRQQPDAGRAARGAPTGAMPAYSGNLPG